MHLQISYCIW